MRVEFPPGPSGPKRHFPRPKPRGLTKGHIYIPNAPALSCSTVSYTSQALACNSHALVHATVHVGTVLIWYLIFIRYQM